MRRKRAGLIDPPYTSTLRITEMPQYPDILSPCCYGDNDQQYETFGTDAKNNCPTSDSGVSKADPTQAPTNGPTSVLQTNPRRVDPHKLVAKLARRFNSDSIGTASYFIHNG